MKSPSPALLRDVENVVIVLGACSLGRFLAMPVAFAAGALDADSESSLMPVVLEVAWLGSAAFLAGVAALFLLDTKSPVAWSLALGLFVLVLRWFPDGWRAWPDDRLKALLLSIGPAVLSGVGSALGWAFRSREVKARA